MSAHYIEAGKEVIRSEPNRRLPACRLVFENS